MSNRFFLMPAPNRMVRKPSGGYLPAKGDWVNRESYWLRRLEDKDVIQDKSAVEPKDEPTTTTPPADPASGNSDAGGGSAKRK
jgi:hypothetical protein